MNINLENFRADNIPTQRQVEDLGKFLIENFESEIGGNKEASGEGVIEMAVRLLSELKKLRKHNRTTSELIEIMEKISVDRLTRPYDPKTWINYSYEVAQALTKERTER